MRTAALILAMLVVGALFGADAPVRPEAITLFTTDVKPILLQHCLKCHGGEKTKGEFDLSTREGLLHPGHEGTNVIPGDSKKSRLMKLVRHEDEPNMPAKADPLSADAIAKLAAWIDAGAPYDKPLIEKGGAKRPRNTVSDEDRKFWSFVPLAKVMVPAVKDIAWARSDVDRFILAKLDAKGIAPNPIADRRKLIRRAYLDLLGLPPKPAEVESFVNDPDPLAWEKLVDRLLDSPHYGERWARHWLDLARFAESHGYEHDYDRPTAYHYRDFLIRAFNEDMPFDRFVKLQLAGDEIEPKNPEALKATGYLAAGTHATQITVATAEKERYDELDDMASTVGTSLLGLTVGCARCHDHKYDPIPAKDYYRLVSTFTTTVRSDIEVDLDPAGYQKQKEEFDRKHQTLVDALMKDGREALPARFEAWLARGERAPLPRWVTLDMTSTKSSGGATMTKQVDGSYLVSGKRPQHDTYTFVATTTLRGITAVRLDALADPSLVRRGPGRADNGNFALTDFSFTAAAKGSKDTVTTPLKNPRATFEQKNLPVAATIDQDNTSGWAVDPQFGKDHSATWELESPIDFEPGATLTFTLRFNNNIGHAIGRPRLSITTAPLPATLDTAPGAAVALEVNRILDKPAGDRDDADRAKLLAYFKSIDPEQQRLAKLVNEDLKRAPSAKKFKVLACSEGVPPVRLHTSLPNIPDFYNKTYFLKRGDVNNKDGEAPAGFLSVLIRSGESEDRWRVTPPADSRLSYRRTALANWLTDPQHGAGHLLARVIVNRLWQHHMGRGIVATPNDFGAQGANPTHPELLDYLAMRLIASGWKLKDIHRLIMTSSVYMQSTAWDAQRAAIDRENALWWRRPVIRLEGEVIRDSMLAVSGQLDRTMFGPGTLDESMKRRSIYFFVKRSRLVPMMLLFDWPDALQGLGQRSTTTVAPQALALMNHPQIQSWAAAMAKDLAPLAKNSPQDAIHQAYQRALGRLPDKTELADAQSFITSAQSQEAGLTAFCQTLFCLNEFIYVE